MTPDELNEVSKKKSSKDRRDRYKEKAQWDDIISSPNTARSHKVYPESFANTAREDFSNINEMHSFIEPENGPGTFENNKEFTLNNGELKNQLKKARRAQRKKNRFGDDPNEDETQQEDSKNEMNDFNGPESSKKLIDNEEHSVERIDVDKNDGDMHQEDAYSVGEIEVDGDETPQ
jgi:hypothetical protein